MPSSLSGRPPRIVTFDVARFLAICGMVLVNFQLVMKTGTVGPAWLVAGVGAFTGRAVALFVVLAGVGVSLMSRRARESGDPEMLGAVRWALSKRALFLFVVGLAYTPIWPADILHFYGLYLVLAIVLLAASDRLLWWSAAGLGAAFVLLLSVLDYEAGWNWDTLEYAGFWTPAGLVRHMLFNGFHPVVPWAGFLLVGMWLGRRDLDDRALRWRLGLVALGTTIVANGLSSWLSRWAESAFEAPIAVEAVKAFVGIEPMPPVPLYLLSAGGTAVLTIVLVHAFCDHFGDRRWLLPFVYTGQLALTHYVAHVVLGLGTLESIGWFEGRSLADTVLATLLFCGLAVAFSWLWRRRFRRGPLEWMMRRSTG